MKTDKANGKDTVKMDSDKGQQWPQVLAICISSLTSICGGLSFSWTSPSLPKIVNDSYYHISEEEATFFTVIPPISMIISVPLFSQLSDKIGRKKMILLMGVLYLISWILVTVARDVLVFYAARVIVGMGDACLFSALPMYIGEICTPEVRGKWGNMLTFNIYLGQVSINVIGSYFSVFECACISMVVPVVFLLTFPFMPESPYYFAMKGRDEDAKKSLIWLRRKENIENDFNKLKADVHRQLSESGTWKDLFLIESNRKALYAGLFLRIVQQFGGISVFATYTQFIFQKAGGNLSASTSAIIFSATVCVLNFAFSHVLDKLGRRKAFMYSCLSSGIILFLMAVYFYIDVNEPQIDMTSINWIPLAGMMTFVVTYSFGLGIVPTLMLGELFSASIKVKGLTFLTFVFGILVSSITKLFYFLNTNFGLFCPFLLFSASSIVGTILTIYFVPETKGKTLEEIQQALKGKKKQSIPT